MCLTDCDGKQYDYGKSTASKRAAIRAARTAQAQISVPDRLSDIEDKLSRILSILNNRGE